MKGLISSIAAPVVPMTDAKAPPIARIIVLVFGLSEIVPCRYIPPVITNNAPSNAMNGR